MYCGRFPYRKVERVGIVTLTVDEQLYHFADDLEKAVKYEINSLGEFDDILMCGMGGSAISSDIVASLCYEESAVPIRVMKFPLLPEWAGEKTLVVCSSYSGNTQEVISIYEAALANGCTVVVLTSGGVLKSKATDDGVLCIGLPDNMHPRHSIGYMIGYTLAVVKAAGGPDLSEDILDCIPSLRVYRDTVCNPGTGRAWEMAQSFKDRLPIILSDELMKPIALRWKTQINENAKNVAFNNEMQEFNTCAIDAWKKVQNINCSLLILQDGTGDPDSSVMKLHREHCPFGMEYFDSGSRTENMFRALILGDYISMYVAKMRGIGAGDVPPITFLKDLLKQMVNPINHTHNCEIH